MMKTAIERIFGENPLPIPERHQWVYFIHMNGCVKFGISINPNRREQIAQKYNPYSVRLIGKFPGNISIIESLKIRFANDKLQNGWYTLSDEFHDYIKKVNRSSV